MSGKGCVVCECPVADGAVAVSELDMERLSRWWTSSKRPPKLFPLDAGVCKFCVFDAR